MIHDITFMYHVKCDFIRENHWYDIVEKFCRFIKNNFQYSKIIPRIKKKREKRILVDVNT